MRNGNGKRLKKRHQSGSASPVHTFGPARVVIEEQRGQQSYLGDGYEGLWVSILVDCHTSGILSSHITFNPPSHITIMALVVLCALRTCSLPVSIIVPEEFRSETLKRFLEELGVVMLADPAEVKVFKLDAVEEDITLVY